MKKTSLLKRGTVLIFFAVLAAAAALLGRGGQGKVSMEELERTEETMRGSAFLHIPPEPTVFPKKALFCQTCHTFPPHQGSGVETAFLNQHTLQVDCLICHWARRSGSRSKPVWVNQIVPGRDGSSETKRVILTLAEMNKNTNEDFARMREELITGQPCFDRGPKCRTCHRPSGMKDYLRPGMSPKKAAALEKLPERFIMPAGTKWYFPQAL